MARCVWCTDDPLYIAYHDQQWGVPQHDPRELFELLILEGFQAGLSWLTVLRKRQHLARVLGNFAPEHLARLGDADIDALMQDPGIIRNRRKLHAARSNARAWLALADPAAFVWSFVGRKPRINHFAEQSQVPAQTPESQAMSGALKKAGFAFVGPTICYAFMQAAGLVMDHTQNCYRYAELARRRQ